MAVLANRVTNAKNETTKSTHTRARKHTLTATSIRHTDFGIDTMLRDGNNGVRQSLIASLKWSHMEFEIGSFYFLTPFFAFALNENRIKCQFMEILISECKIMGRFFLAIRKYIKSIPSEIF